MIPFSPPKIDQKTIDAVVEVLQSGWITTGPVTRLFEQRLTCYNGNPNTLCVSSATAGLELMLRWYGVGLGDEVILPAYTYAATGNVILHLGAKPVFVDVDPNFMISLEEIQKALTSHTKAIIPVDIGGMPADYEPMMHLVTSESTKKIFIPSNKIQEKLGRPLILSDAAHSLGAVYKNKKTGNHADISIFSFHAVKNLTTGEGGAIALNLPNPFDNSEIYEYLKVYALHGQSKDAFNKSKRNGWEYDILCPGYKANMPDILAAIGLVEIERYQSETLPKRQSIFNFYSQALIDQPGVILPIYQTPTKTSSYHLYMLRLKGYNNLQRDRMIQKLYDEGIAVNIHFKPLPMMSYYKKLGYHISEYPMAYHLYENEISLPVYYTLNQDNMDYIMEKLIHLMRVRQYNNASYQ